MIPTTQKTEKCKRIAPLLLAVILLMSCGLSAIAETVLATETTRAYQLPSTGAASVSICAGTVLEMTAEQDGWARVEKGGRTAYMKKSSLTKVIDCNGTTGYVSEKTPMYKKYGSADKYGTLPVGTAVSVYAVAGEWCYVGCKNYKGFVRKNCLSTSKPAANEEVQENPDSGEASSDLIVTRGKYAYTAVEGAKVYKSYSTSSSLLGTLPINTRLSVGAVRGDWAFVSLNGFYGFMKTASLSEHKVETNPEPDANTAEDSADSGKNISSSVPDSADLGKSSAVPAKGTAIAMDWWESDIQNIFARGVTATITDVATGIAWTEIRKGGTNHADVQPLTAADTAAMKATVDKWSWDRRAVFVTIDGVNYAASMNCMPHGSGSISNNNFNGHHCIHFTNSRGNSSNKVCQLHQAAIAKALSAKL